jgi:2,3-bisphosphoglycerate-independent phosphoglycerate mutase
MTLTPLEAVTLDISTVWEDLITDGGRIIYLVMDGAADLPDPSTGLTPLQTARTPNFDALARSAASGMLELVGPGITPGSGPGHLALFGYDPLRLRLGRGVLSALGIDFPLREGDLAARVNFATLAEDGTVQDRRAGRIPTELNERLCRQILDGLDLDFDGELFLETESEHRAVLVLRGGGLSDALLDTDPQRTDVPPVPVEAGSPEAGETARVVSAFLTQANAALAGEAPANSLLLRGFQCHSPIPSLEERFGLRGLCLAQYPMYRGLSRLLGMEVAQARLDLGSQIDILRQHYGQDDRGFYFLHVKGTDKAGEDGEFEDKVRVIEAVDAEMPRLMDIQPDVLAVTADHSTPAMMAAHSWHPVPVLLHSPYVRRDAAGSFNEIDCARGSLGLRPGLHLMGLALANAGRLKKFGA